MGILAATTNTSSLLHTACEYDYDYIHIVPAATTTTSSLLYISYFYDYIYYNPAPLLRRLKNIWLLLRALLQSARVHLYTSGPYSGRNLAAIHNNRFSGYLNDDE